MLIDKNSKNKHFFWCVYIFQINQVLFLQQDAGLLFGKYNLAFQNCKKLRFYCYEWWCKTREHIPSLNSKQEEDEKKDEEFSKKMALALEG